MTTEKAYCVFITVFEEKSLLRYMISNFNPIKAKCNRRFFTQFKVNTEFEEEAIGLKDLLKRLLPGVMRRDILCKEFQDASEELFQALCTINNQNFTDSQLTEIEDSGSMEEYEVVLHSHDYKFELSEKNDFSILTKYSGMMLIPDTMTNIVQDSLTRLKQ